MISECLNKKNARFDNTAYHCPSSFASKLTLFFFFKETCIWEGYLAMERFIQRLNYSVIELIYYYILFNNKFPIEENKRLFETLFFKNNSSLK